MKPLPEDLATSVRAGEVLDEGRLQTYLEGTLGVSNLRVEQFPSGFSNLTYRLTARDGDGEKEFVLRRPPFGSKVRSAHDMGREYEVLSRLTQAYRVPRPVLYCEDEEVLGAPFYLMERVRGTILRGSMGAADAPEPATMRRIAENSVAALAELHALDYEALGLQDFGKPEGYVQRQVAGWLARYEKSKTDDVPELEPVGAWLLERVEEISTRSGPTTSLVHNDFKYDNVVLDLDDPTRIRAVLDWEMATLGDPLLDLGTSLAYWVDPDDPDELKSLSFSPTTLPGNPRRAEVAELYAQHQPIDEGALVFAYAFGLIKIAVIVQQIYYRFRQGHTDDPRFAHLGHAVRALDWAARRATELGRIDQLSS